MLRISCSYNIYNYHNNNEFDNNDNDYDDNINDDNQDNDSYLAKLISILDDRKFNRHPF